MFITVCDCINRPTRSLSMLSFHWPAGVTGPIFLRFANTNTKLLGAFQWSHQELKPKLSLVYNHGLKAVVIARISSGPEFLTTAIVSIKSTGACQRREKEKVQVPGWPEHIKGKEKFITDDCVRFER